MQWILEQTGYSSVYLLILSLVGNFIAWVLRNRYPTLAAKIDRATPLALEAGVPRSVKEFTATALEVYRKVEEKKEALPEGAPVSATLFAPDGSTAIQVTHDAAKSATIQPSP